MLLSEVASATVHNLLGGDTEICGLQYDSRKVKKGDVFCCIVGTFADGHEYARQAVKAGAAALVVQRALDIDIPQLFVPDARVAMAEMAARFYGYPARDMKIIGVTGTNGKTSTTYMIKAVAERMGYKVGLIGTIRNLIGDSIIDTERTTPDSVDLQRIMRQMLDSGVELVVMEVSSHSLHQKRVHGIEFDIAVFTNITQDHLDYHHTFENYLNVKKSIFSQAKLGIANADDAHAKAMMEGEAIPFVTYGIRERADISASEIDITTKGVQFDLRAEHETFRIYTPIPGLFSVFNAMAAAGAALQMGWDSAAIRDGLEHMAGVSGRLEPLDTQGRDFTVILDYAHTPDALENVLTAVKGFAQGRLVTLFGCGGDRDFAKRPIMGEIAGRFSDFLVVTSDNPRSEEPMAIIAAIMDGVQKSGCPHVVIEDRKEAIRYALKHAQPKDVIVLAGKGHENYQEIGGGKLHFDEKEIVAELLSEMGAATIR